MPKWTDYTIKTNPADKDEMMILDTAGKANKRLGLSALSDWIIGKIANKVFENLQTQSKTILGALNELNSKQSKAKFIDSGNASTFEIKNMRAWIFICAPGSDGDNGPYGIFLYTPSYSNVPTIKNVIRSDSSFALSAEISNNNVIIKGTGIYLQVFVIYCQ